MAYLCMIMLILLYIRAVINDTRAPLIRLKGATAKSTKVYTLPIAGLIAAPAARMDSKGIKLE